ncbi:TSUP family transporter [Actinomycetospora sp. TBRC 11914]|uniref:TSUP family transporter n=1 Tax=Actinomycetospora sp. TBRC 11914 TaxID=2729387 RepID=UPI00145E3C12|nr:TSUP family transporter [Actinomycetospora sp. TBRC 11914]NMO92773.1 TSUP family transporter [Actinomycetospora sp. TBRC 11914]
MNPVLTALLVGIPVAGGAALQRTTGLGLALVGAPFLVAALGPQDGVSFGNALQTVLCLLVLAGTWRATRWGAAGALLLGAAVGVPAGALLVDALPAAPLEIVVGLLALVGIGLAVLPQAGAVLRGFPGAVGSGLAAGFVNAAAGVGGPLVSAYGIAQQWDRTVLVPTAQVVLLAINVVSLLLKGLPDLDAATWTVGAAALVIGVAAGGPVSRRLGPVAGRRLLLAVATAGAAATVVRGLLTL